MKTRQEGVCWGADRPWNLVVRPGLPVSLPLPETLAKASPERCVSLRTDRAVHLTLSCGDKDQKCAPTFILLLP